MAAIIRAGFILLVLSFLTEKIFAGRIDSTVSEELEALLDRDDGYYEPQEIVEYIPPGMILKKGAFWSPHPSDYNPMRRPGTSNTQQVPKRATYHPLPRTILQQQKNAEDLDGLLLQGMRDKRQLPGSYLLLKLGRTKPTPPKTSGRK